MWPGGWFSKSIYAEARFDADNERRMAMIIDAAPEVMKWARLAGPPRRIDWGHGAGYEPDFVVETGDRKYPVETKAANQMDDPEVLAKAMAATTWCRHASAYAAQHGGKAWVYLLIPDAEVTAAASLPGSVAQWSRP